MNALAPKLKDVLVQHIGQASPAELAQIVGSICGKPANGGLQSQLPILTAPAGGRFLKIGADGSQVLDAQDGEHVAVHDTRTGLTWSRRGFGSGRMNWKDADAACRALDLAGHQDWRLPTIQELLSIVDYERSEPAIDTSFFDCESAWYWTSTPAAASPADFVWFVYFGDGYSSWDYRGYGFLVRAVRPGQ